MKDFVHGASGYSNQKCRCDICRTEWNAYCARKKNERRAAYVYDESDPHGEEKLYQRGCSCAKCKQAHAARHREIRYAITPTEYDRLLAAQNGVCAICETASRRLVVDHVHGTSEVRGLLCDACNTALGKLGDTREGLMRAVAYLDRHLLG